MTTERGWQRAGIAARAGIATAAVVAGGMATLVTASAHHVVSAIPLCGAPDALAPCVSGPNVVGATDLYDQATVYASADRYVRFLLWAPGTCGVAGASAVESYTVPVGGSAGLHTGVIQTPSGVLAGTVGTYNWTTEILRHDLSLEWGPAPCSSQQVNVVRATPQVGVPPLDPITVGAPANDSATVTGGDAPTGVVNFSLFGPADQNCNGIPLQVWSSPLASGAAATEGPFATSSIGEYHWTAAYSGDADNNPVSSACAAQPLTVGPAQPAISTAPSAGGVLGTTIQDSALVSGGDAPQGSVSYALYGPSDTTCSGAPLFFDTQALPATSPLATHSLGFTPSVAGTYHWSAQFVSGDSNNLNASHLCGDAVTITAPQQGGNDGNSGSSDGGHSGSTQQGATSGTGGTVESGVQGAVAVPQTGGAGAPLAGVALLLTGIATATGAVIRRSNG